MDNPVINYQLVGIELVYMSIESMPIKGVGTKFTFDLRVEIKVNAQNKLVLPFVTIKIREAKDNVELAKIGVSCLFLIQDFEKYIVLNEKGLYHVPPVLETAIRPIAISTARGVMYSEFKGTYLNHAVLPVVNMTTLKKEEKV